MIMVGGSKHGTRCNKPYPDDYQIETLTTRNPANFIKSHTVAVHTDLLLHRKLPASSIMYQASEDALMAYVLDALLRVVNP